MGSGRSPKRRVRDDDFILGYRRIILESSFYWRKHFREFPLKSSASRFRGRRNISWGWRVTLVAPRIGNEVSYVTQIIDDIHFAWQAQYLVRLEGDFTCSTHWKWGFICDADHWWHSFCVAGAVFGEVRVGLFMTGAALRDILGDSRSAKCCILQYKIVSKMGRVRSPKRRVRDDDFIVGYRRIIVGLSSNRLSIGGSTSGSFRWNLEASRFRGRRSIWWGWRVTLVAPRIGNEVSYVTQIIDDIHFAWQAQYLVRLEGDFTCSTHWKWGFICDADHWWHSFCVAGAVFGEVGGWLFVTGAALRDILGDSRDAKCCILQYKIVSKMGRVRSPKRRVRDDDFIVGYRRISSDYGRIVFLLAEALQGFSAQILTFKISWQAQYLVRLEGDLTGSAHWKWRFICDADHWWRWFCVAGAVFGEVGGWLDLLHALEMSFHMWRRSSMTFILRGRRSIWWDWWHSFCVAGAVFGEVGRWLLLRRAL